MNATQKFFIECIKHGIKNQQVLEIPKDIDYKQLYNLCIEHSTSVIVFKALESLHKALPQNFYLALQKTAYRHVVQDVQGEHDKNEFLLKMEECNLKHMPLKGYILKKLYPVSEMRYTSDCDVLIDLTQIKQVRALVKSLGLQTKRRDEHHDIVFYPATKTIIELHKCLFVGYLQKYFGIGFEKAKLKEGTKAFYQLSNEDFYITILAHSAYHFAESAGVGIRHLIDVFLFKNAYKLNYEYLDVELEKCGLKVFKDMFEQVADYFFDDKPASQDALTLAEYILDSSVLANEKNKRALEVSLSDNAVDSKKARKKAFWKKIFPSKENMKFSYPILKKAGWLLPFFYPIRWFHVLFTRPKNIGQLKEYSSVDENKLKQMQDISNILKIKHL